MPPIVIPNAIDPAVLPNIDNDIRPAANLGNIKKVFRFPSISFLAQNVQSLNISSLCKKTSKKMYSVSREKDDIIFLSDIRLNSTKQVSATLDIGKRFAFRGYNFIHNSTTNSRGVGILISNKLQAIIHRTHIDMDGNILIIDVTIGGKRITIG
jgi:hypothetical protein